MNFQAIRISINLSRRDEKTYKLDFIKKEL